MPMFLGGFHVHTSARHHGGQRRYHQTATAEQHRLGFGDEPESNSSKINSWRAGVRTQDQQYLELGSTGWLEPGSTTRSHPRSPPSHTLLKTDQHVLVPMLLVSCEPLRVLSPPVSIPVCRRCYQASCPPPFGESRSKCPPALCVPAPVR